MSQITLRAHKGREPGSRSSRRLRRQGMTPAIVYGPGLDPLLVAVDSRELNLALHTEAGVNAIIELDIDGDDTVTTMARVIDKHPFRNEYRHVDFVKVDLSRKVHAEVAVHFEGEPEGVLAGGVFSPAKTHVLVEVLPTEIPSFIELDVSEVDLGGSLRVADLPEMEGVQYLDDPEAVLMSITAPAAEIEEPVEEEEELEGEEEAAEEGEETAEGEAPEAAEDEAADGDD